MVKKISDKEKSRNQYQPVVIAISFNVPFLSGLKVTQESRVERPVSIIHASLLWNIQVES